MRWAGRRWREQREAGWAPAEAAATVLKASDSRFLRLLGACGAWTEGQGRGRGRNPEGGEERALAPGYSDGVSRAATPFCGAGSRRTRGLPGARGCRLCLDLVLEMPLDEETGVLRAGEPAGPLAAPHTLGAGVDLVL